MKNNFDYIFFIEHKDREFDSICAIAQILKERGNKCLILSIHYHIHFIYKYTASTYVFPYVLGQNDWPINVISKMYGASVNYINMNWEQLLSPVNLEYKRPRDNFARDEVIHISWSEQFERYLVDNGVKASNIYITGNPANEVLYNLKDKYDDLRVLLAKQYSLDSNKKWLFMPMNYAWAFSSNELIQGKISKGYPEKIAWEFRQYSKKCLEKFIYFINDIVVNYDYEVIIRPHPSISEDQYRKKFTNIFGNVPKNTHLNKSLSIREWIIASDFIGSSWSTSVWDAYNIGKPIFLFTPYERPEWLDVAWNNDVTNFNETYEEKYLLSSVKTGIPTKSIENIAQVFDQLPQKLPARKTKMWLGLVSTQKLILSFLRNAKLLPSRNLKYDYFKKIFL